MTEIYSLISAAILAEEGDVVTAEVAGEAQNQVSAAANGSPQGDVESQGTPEQKPFNPMSLALPVLLFVVMYFILFRGPRKQQKEQQKMRSSLAKNDRVVTIGGMYGIILDITDDEVTLKVDESNNTKIKMAKAAISRKV
ncbi:preprotein translocase subunit YajC [Limihaloglobus sulfuriphilus]|uniref:Sec translocon accessory complex subunit YajC n=1 Tax=Limihaloglobus sulfuriphilus TaxID=1851148 RepID=A0A1Q2MIS1_9BACT|nr:preprotein translocase subunit YajC [Limihaloglobus sulfuriphilus]AQQ72152.1 preprotein translocase subunit YajC [Limihaloglobus sulfuriphilus]